MDSVETKIAKYSLRCAVAYAIGISETSISTGRLLSNSDLKANMAKIKEILEAAFLQDSHPNDINVAEEDEDD